MLPFLQATRCCSWAVSRLLRSQSDSTAQLAEWDRPVRYRHFAWLIVHIPVNARCRFLRPLVRSSLRWDLQSRHCCVARRPHCERRFPRPVHRSFCDAYEAALLALAAIASGYLAVVRSIQRLRSRRRSRDPQGSFTPLNTERCWPQHRVPGGRGKRPSRVVGSKQTPDPTVSRPYQQESAVTLAREPQKMIPPTTKSLNDSMLSDFFGLFCSPGTAPAIAGSWN